MELYCIHGVVHSMAKKKNVYGRERYGIVEKCLLVWGRQRNNGLSAMVHTSIELTQNEQQTERDRTTNTITNRT